MSIVKHIGIHNTLEILAIHSLLTLCVGQILLSSIFIEPSAELRYALWGIPTSCYSEHNKFERSISIYGVQLHDV